MVGSKHFDWIPTEIAWLHLDNTALISAVPDPFDKDVEEQVLLGVASVGRDQVRGKPPVEFRTESGAHVDRQVGLEERTDYREDTVDLPVPQRLGSLPTCKRRFSCRSPVVLPD